MVSLRIATVPTAVEGATAAADKPKAIKLLRKTLKRPTAPERKRKKKT